MGNSKKARFFVRQALCLALIFSLSGISGIGIARGEENTASSEVAGQDEEARSEEIRKALEEAAELKKQKDTTPVSSVGSSDRESRLKETEKIEPPQSGISGEKETSLPGQDLEKQAPLPSEKEAPEALPEERRFEYAVLENVTWETLEKKIILKLWISGQATPAAEMIRDQNGMKMRLRPKGLATRMRRTLPGFPPGVQSFSILAEPKLAKVWGLEAPYYAVEEIQVLFAFPVQYSLSQDPGLLKVTFLLPKKVEPKKIEPPPEPPAETIDTMQREALGSPENTLGTSYQAQGQLEDAILYGAQKPPSIKDLYKKEREETEFKAASGLPENVGPVLEARHPQFGSAEYFKKYVHGDLRQTFGYTTNYNQGLTTAFGENSTSRGNPSRGENLGTILGTPAIALLFYRPGTVNVSTGYSASKDFPMTHNNFFYGLNRQNINLSFGHYSKKRYAIEFQNNLQLFGGTTRQKIDGKWVKAPSLTRQGYQLSNRLGVNYKLSNRLLWGVGTGTSRTRSESKIPGGRSRDIMGELNTYFKYRATRRLDLLVGTDFIHVFKDTSGNFNADLPANSIMKTTKGKNVQSVFFSADYRYSKKIRLKGSLQGSLIDWDIPKIGGSAGITYQRTPHDDLSFQFSSSVIQDNTAKILARAVSVGNRYGITLQRYVTMGLRYNRQFDRGKTRGALEVRYRKNCNLSDVFYGNATTSITNYDILFSASVRRAILENRAWLGLLYSYEYAPNRSRNDTTGVHDFYTNTSQNILATMDYQF